MEHANRTISSNRRLQARLWIWHRPLPTLIATAYLLLFPDCLQAQSSATITFSNLVNGNPVTGSSTQVSNGDDLESKISGSVFNGESVGKYVHIKLTLRENGSNPIVRDYVITGGFVNASATYTLSEIDVQYGIPSNSTAPSWTGDYVITLSDDPDPTSEDGSIHVKSDSHLFYKPSQGGGGA
jgi:hypothetical protein